LPDWVRQERYDVTAIPALNRPTQEQQTPMFRAMLADRFMLVAHMEKREQPVYDLVVARNDGRLGPNIKLSNVDCDAKAAADRTAAVMAFVEGTAPPPLSLPKMTGPPPLCSFRVVGNQTEGSATMDTLSRLLRGPAGRPVINKTGLKGSYLISLRFNRSDLQIAGDSAPSIFSAVPEQLGLTLKSSRGTREILVVDHIERPSDAASTSVTAPQDRVPTGVASRPEPIATLCGKVVAFRCLSPDKTTFLDLDTPSATEGVTVRITSDARSLFRPRIEDAYFSENVCATGRVQKSVQRDVVTVETPDALMLAAGQPVERVFAPNAVSSCDVGVELPKLVYREQPRYTAAALGAQITGTVLLEAVVQTNGKVGETRVLRSLEPGLDQEALFAVKKWRFESGTQDGKPVPVLVNVEMSFTIRPR
jgi:uncharacterized protein (TIGR03435 family)